MSDTMILGEVRGQMRELVHTINNLSLKFDGLSREVIGLGPLATDIGEMKVRLAAMEVRLTALETERNRRDGANGLLSMILKSPALGWLAGAAISAWAILTGKVHV
jgi:hypothetical protein